MNTKDISKGAILCALYGVLLQVNLLGSLFIENYFPFLLALPLMAAGLTSSKKVLQAVLVSMIILTFILSGLTTWLLALSMLLSAFALCLPFCRQAGHDHAFSHPNLQTEAVLNRKEIQEKIDRSFVICLLVQVICTFASMTLLASLFGYSMEEDSALFALFASFLNPYGVLFIAAVIVGVSQSVLLELMLQIMLNAFGKRKIPFIFPLSDPKPWIAWTFLISLTGAIFFLAAPVLKWTMICKDVLVILACVSGIWLDILGTRRLLQSEAAQKSSAYFLRLGIVLCAFIPFLMAVPIVAGLMACLKKRED